MVSPTNFQNAFDEMTVQENPSVFQENREFPSVFQENRLLRPSEGMDLPAVSSLTMAGGFFEAVNSHPPFEGEENTENPLLLDPVGSAGNLLTGPEGESYGERWLRLYGEERDQENPDYRC